MRGIDDSVDRCLLLWVLILICAYAVLGCVCVTWPYLDSSESLPWHVRVTDFLAIFRGDLIGYMSKFVGYSNC